MVVKYLRHVIIACCVGPVASLLVTACGDDNEAEVRNGLDGGGGGTAGTAGTAGTGGSPSDGGLDAQDTGANDAAGCPAGQVLRYEAAGCNATPECGPPGQDACLTPACSCDGETIGGCDYYSKPYQHLGACADAADASPD
jgi:hypothetical protein